MRQYGLIGYPLTHSFSKKYFTEKFEKENVCSSYLNFEIDTIEKLPGVIMNNPDLIGLNVTIPYKEKVIAYLDELDPSAKNIGAVNTIKILRPKNKNTLKGYNTDIFGFKNSLLPLLKDHHQKAMILGTGGASKAVKFVLNELGIDFISVSRKLKDDFTISYNEITEKLIAGHHVIINTTPLGTFPKTDRSPDIPYHLLTEKHLLYDLVYNPEVTQFMKQGKDRGANVKNGYEMLLLQAQKSYEIWNTKE